MALSVCWRFALFYILCVVFLNLGVGLSYSDKYYQYEYGDSQSAHNVVRRSALSEEREANIHEGKPSTQVAEIVQLTSTPIPPVASHPAPAGSYVTRESNMTVINPQDGNHTLWPTSSVSTSASPLPPSNITTMNSTVLLQNNTNKVNNMTLVISKGVSPGNVSDSGEADDDDITIDRFSHPIDNDTLKNHHIAKYEHDYHKYYNSSFIRDNKDVGHQYWVNMTNRPDVQVNDMLSQSHRRAATVKLSFDFPFYGHLVRNVTIATGGFLYTGEYVHSWLAATQYIAPLMANFDTSISNNSYVKYVDNGTAFTVQWEKVVLQDRPNSGDFTFQATLHSNGDIIFVYQNVPVVIKNIQDDHHPVKVGLSDAYIIDRTIFFVRRKTIYEYHRVNFNRQEIMNWTVIMLHALPTCVDQRDCAGCLTVSTDFMCKWCPVVNRCSSGLDRHRQDWLFKGCEKSAFSDMAQCPAATANVSFTSQISEDGPPNNIVGGESNSATQTNHIQSTREHNIMHRDEHTSMSISGIIGILVIIALVACLGVWVLYAYRNPHTASGQLLIRYRPSQWSWKRGEARYTAATIHM